jgi:hypothetical protein
MTPRAPLAAAVRPTFGPATEAEAAEAEMRASAARDAKVESRTTDAGGGLLRLSTNCPSVWAFIEGDVVLAAAAASVSHLSSVGNAHFTIASVHGKGLGIIANHTLAAGDRVLSELPLLSVSTNRDADAAIRRSVAALSVRDRATFRALSSGGMDGGVAAGMAGGVPDGAARTAAASWDVGIWRSNAYRLDTGESPDGSKTAACFALACRFNHSCVPNCHIDWNSDTGEQTVQAVRPIASGDELTVSYIDAGLDHAHRASMLSSKFGFTCTCGLCSHPVGAARVASDTRQRRIAQLEGLIARRANPHAVGGHVEERISLLTAQGQPAIWAKADMLSAVIASNDVGERHTAGEWVARGREASRIACGTDSSEFKMYDEFHTRHLEEAREEARNAACVAQILGSRRRGNGRREQRRQQRMRQ